MEPAFELFAELAPSRVFIASQLADETEIPEQ
jgi:hypothetical protein